MSIRIWRCLYVIGERLRLLRKNRKISQEALAEAIGVRKSTVSQYETNINDPSDPVKIAIAKYFNVSIDYLMGLTDIETTFYDEARFWEIPETMTEEGKSLIRDFIEFVACREEKRSETKTK